MPSPAEVTPRLLRVLLLAGLAGAAALSLSQRHGPDPGVALTLVGEDSRGWAAALAGSHPPPGVVRLGPDPPPWPGAELLAGVAAEVPVQVALAPAEAGLRVWLSPGLREGRAGAVGVALQGTPGDTVTVTLVRDDGVGEVAPDPVQVILGPDGTGERALRIRPQRAGWQRWWVEGGGSTAVIGAWVKPEERIRILALAGAPTWETRFVLRALEEWGAEVVVRQELGRGVVSGPDPFPSTPEGFQPYHVVLLLSGAVLPPESGEGLRRWVGEWGGGLLRMAGGDAGPLDGAGLSWNLPAELAPLPPLPVAVSGVPLSEGPGRWVALRRSAGGDPLLILEGEGAGRIVTVGLRESWRWRSEAGAVDEHREFWRSLVEWAAGGIGDPWVLAPHPLVLPREVPVRVQVAVGSGPSAGLPGRLEVESPSGTRQALAVREVGAGRGEGVFLPLEEGIHRIRAGVGEEDAVWGAVEVVSEGEGGGGIGPPLSRGEFTLLLGAAGGSLVPEDSARTLARGGVPPPGSGGILRAGILLVLLSALPLVEWSVRRLRGER